jgi:hypothetical protein
MGLDTVELVIAIKDAFEVRIGNDDSAKMTTPNEVTDYLMGRIRTVEAILAHRKLVFIGYEPCE